MRIFFKKLNKWSLYIVLFLVIFLVSCLMHKKINNVLVASGNAIGCYMKNNLHFGISDVEVIGAKFFDSERFIEENKKENRLIFSLNINDKYKEILSDPWVKEVIISRVLPNKLVVKIVEREPVAVFSDANGDHIVDSDGDFIIDDNKGVFVNLIRLKGDGALENMPDLLKLISSEDLFANLVCEAEMIGRRRWDIIFHNGVRVMLPEEDPMNAWSYIANAQRKSAVVSGNIKNIDLRLKDKLFLLKD